MKKKSIITIIIAFLVITFLSFLAFRPQEKKEIILGTIGSDEKIWKQIANSKEAKKDGIKLKVKTFTDGVALNKATSDGTVDVNAFQSYAYLVAYNQKNKKDQLQTIGTTYLEPMGLYSKQYKSLDDLPDGATIAIANNAANTARGLKLLASAGLITLKDNFGSLSGLSGIKSNLHNFKFKEVDDTTGPRLINDQSIAAALIGNTIAQQGGLNVLKDSIIHEKVDQSTKDNVNILAASKNSKRLTKLKKLVKLYHQKSIQNYIKKDFDGTKVEVDKPVSYLTN